MLSDRDSQYASYVNEYPEEVIYGYNVPRHTTSSLLKSLITTGITLVTAPLITSAANSVLKAVSTRAAAAVARYAAKPTASRALSWFASAYQKASLSVAERTAAGGAPTLGAVLRRTPLVDDLISKYRSFLTSRGIDVSEYARWKAMANRMADPRGHIRQHAVSSTEDIIKDSAARRLAYKSSQYMARRRAFFSDVHSAAFNGRLVGHIEDYMARYARELPGLFVADRAIGFLTGDRPEGTQPPWWNVPARAAHLAADFAKTAVGYLPVQVAFSGLLQAAKLGYYTLERSARYKFLLRQASRVRNAENVLSIPRVHERVYGGNPSAAVAGIVHSSQPINRYSATTGLRYRRRDTGTLVYNAAQKFDEFVHRTRVSAPGRFMHTLLNVHKDIHISTVDDGKRVSLLETLKRIGKNVKARYAYRPDRRPSAVSQLPKSFMLSDIEQLVGKGIVWNAEIGSAFEQAMTYAYGRPRLGFFSRIMGLRPLSYNDMPGVRDNMVNQLLTSINLGPGADTAIEAKLRAFVGRRYYGRGVFRAGDNVLNLSGVMPSKLISRAIDWATEHIKVRVPLVGTLKVLDFFRVGAIKEYLMQDVPSVIAFKEGDIVRVGPIGPLVSSIPSYDPTGAVVKLGQNESIFRFNVGWNKGRLFYTNRGGDTHEFINVPNYKVMRTTTSTSIRQINALYYGGLGEELNSWGAINRADLKQKLQDYEGYSPLKAWVHAYLLRPISESMQAAESARAAAAEAGSGQVPRSELRRFSGLEIGAGYGGTGIIGRAVGVIKKYFSRESPLVAFAGREGFLQRFESSLRDAPGNLPITSVGDYNDYVKFLRKVDEISDVALSISVKALKRREVYNELKHMNVPGMRGIKLGDIFDDTEAGMQNLISAATQIIGRVEHLHQPRGELARISNILGIVSRDGRYLGHTVTEKHGVDLTYADELRKFVLKYTTVARAMRSQQRSKRLATLSDMMSRIGAREGSLPLSPTEVASIKVVDDLADIETVLGGERPNFLVDADLYNLTNANELISNAHAVITKLIRSRPDLEALSKMIYKPYKTYAPGADRFPAPKAQTTSPYEIIPSHGSIADNMALYGNDTSPVVALLKAIKTKIAPRYARTNRWGTVEILPADQQVPLSGPAYVLTELMMRFNRLGAEIGIGLNLQNKTTWQDIASGVFKKIVFPAIGVYSVYKAADAMVDASPLFDQTALDEGITVAIAEQTAKQDLRIARFADFTGITSASKYLEGLMPGSVNSPLARMGLAFGPMLVGAAVGSSTRPAVAGAYALAGLGFSGIMGFGLHDFTKSHEELQDIYTGRELVPVRRSRYWSLSRSPWLGDKISYFRPHFIHRVKSQYQYTPDMWGSKLEEFMFRNPLMMPLSIAIDPYHWERKWYNTAPYPETAPLFNDVPFVGPVLSGTAGRIVKPTKRMHPEEVDASFTGIGYTSDSTGAGPGYFPPPWSNATIDSPFVPATVNERTRTGALVRRPYPVSSTSLRQVFAQSVYRLEEMAGLWGWAAQSLTGGVPFEHSDHIVATPADRTSIARQFWDLQLGESSEYFRRFVPRSNYNKNPRWNPLLVQAMPTWVPGGVENEYFRSFREGSVWDSIPEATLRLPGWGNLAAYNVRLTMPMKASQLGQPLDETIAFLTGTRRSAEDEDSSMRRRVQEELERQNLLVQAEVPVYDPYNDISGTVDAIVRKGRQKLAVEIKTKSTDELRQLAAPEFSHRSQLNFYLKATGLRSGTLLYVSRDDPSIMRVFPVTYNPALYTQNLAVVREARTRAAQLLSDGYGHPGEAYSHLDRLRVLADIAPTSAEYQRELDIVNQLDKMGFLSLNEHRDKLRIIKRRSAVMRSFDMYPRRFKLSDIFFPDSRTQQLSENENIKAAAEYSFPERVIGGIYEYFTHTFRTPIHTKLIATYSPRELYEKNVLYGTQHGFWDHPYSNFIEPYMRAGFSTDRPDVGIVRGAQAGYLLGGGPGAVVGAGVGAIYGTIHGAFRALTGTTHIPRTVKRRWELYEYFDNLEYLKNQRLYEATGQRMYATKMSETMAGIDPAAKDRAVYSQIARAVPNEIRPYVFAFIGEDDKDERERIAKIVPPDVEKLLRIRWAIRDRDRKQATVLSEDYAMSKNLVDYFRSHRLPEESHTIWHPQVQLEDVMLKTIKKEGLSQYDFGLGWASQLDRMARSPLTPGPVNFRDPIGTEVYPEVNIDSGEVAAAIRNALAAYGYSGNVSVQVLAGSGSTVTVHIQ